MDIKFVANTRESDRAANGTCLQGYLQMSYEELKDIFGSPGEGDGYKTRAYWTLLFTGKKVDGSPVKLVATIYDWKLSDEYNGEGNGTPLEDVTQWNVGGHTYNAYDITRTYIENWHQERVAQMAHAYDTFCVEAWDRV